MFVFVDGLGEIFMEATLVNELRKEIIVGTTDYKDEIDLSGVDHSTAQ